MSDKNHTYGTSVVEFFKHDDAELQKLIKEKEISYFRHSESPAYPQLGVNVDWFSDKPLHLALTELTSWLLKGYTIATAISQPLYLKIQLRKPTTITEADLKQLVVEAKADYAQQRYDRNITETQRQIEFTVVRKRREAEAEAARTTEDLLESVRKDALADLIEAYKKPPKVKKAVETPE
ncbi:hypothetical protein KSS94_18710 [Pseudomonas fakonensis]|uniref:Uncharacterized protein n=1 Tax=Pseudomonas fakonensis TaxID=2842355 RepID=A0ABX8N200_9PSED|nr:hypothetical protein [Pseudomonas fakonensis]QXH49967.1 hypothetical protein KSS94_18710 [Pseudomonas fakonensis]